jgi:hypothetical protein
MEAAEMIYPWHFIPVANLASGERLDELEAMMILRASETPRLEGNTAVLVDVSEAMDDASALPSS